jgi:hypothetical protein
MSLSAITGLVLVLTTLTYHSGLALLFMRGQFGQVLSLPRRERFGVIARQIAVYRWGYRIILAAWIVAAMGYVMLAVLLQEAGALVVAALSSTLFLIGIVMAVVFWVFEAPSTLAASEQMARTSTLPPYAEPLQQVADASLWIYQLLGLLATAGFGWALVQSALLPGWTGWATLGWGVVWTWYC